MKITAEYIITKLSEYEDPWLTNIFFLRFEKLLREACTFLFGCFIRLQQQTGKHPYTYLPTAFKLKKKPSITALSFVFSSFCWSLCLLHTAASVLLIKKVKKKKPKPANCFNTRSDYYRLCFTVAAQERKDSDSPLFSMFFQHIIYEACRIAVKRMSRQEAFLDSPA